MTPADIKALTAGQTLRDDIVTGLECRAFPSGRKAFYLWYRTRQGKARHPKVGDCGIMSLADARATARAMLLKVANGGDPAGERHGEKREPNFEDLWTQYKATHQARKKSFSEDERRYLRILAPRFRTRSVRSLCYSDAVGLHGALSHSPYEANRVLALFSRLSSYAERPLEWRQLHSNPCRGVERYAELKRRRFATKDELAAIGSLLKKYAEEQPASVAFIYLLLYSGARPDEIGSCRREWLDGNVLRLPDSKTGQRYVYLPPQAMAVLERLPATGETLLGIKSPRRLWRRIRVEAGCPDLRLYPDLRRSFATVGVAAGNTIDAMGGLLGHKNRQTTLVYARLMEEAATEAAASTATRMAELLG